LGTYSSSPHPLAGAWTPEGSEEKGVRRKKERIGEGRRKGKRKGREIYRNGNFLFQALPCDM